MGDLRFPTRAAIPHREHLGYRYNPIDILRLPFMYCILSFGTVHNGIRGSVIAFLVRGVVHTTRPSGDARERRTYVSDPPSFVDCARR
jgi:hypothetical protein